MSEFELKAFMLSDFQQKTATDKGRAVLMHGWTGKILDIDLTRSEIRVIPTQPYIEYYLGGRGIASRIYWENVAPNVKAFDPENTLIFMTGPLVATGTQGATRLTIAGKSPMTLPEGFCYGNMGGFFPAEIKKAGFDGIVVKGQAIQPVYLWINDDKIEIRDASFLWGQGAYRTGEILQQIHGKNVQFLCTGVAGERRVRITVILATHQSTSVGGFGAVMGSKNLKAIAVLGTGRPSVADPDRLKQLNRYTITISKRINVNVGPGFINHAHLVERLKNRNCYQCGMECFGGLYRYGKELEGYRHCHSMEYYLPWNYSCNDQLISTVFDAPTLANDYSIGTMELQLIINWLYACYKSGSLTEKETGLPLSIIGTREFLEKLLHSIAFREGFGDLLSEGLLRARDRLPERAKNMISPFTASIGIQDLAPARAIVAHALLYPMEPRIHQPIVHEISLPLAAWNINRRHPDRSPVTGTVFHNIARIFWGSDDAGDLSSYSGKALAAKNIQNRTYIKDSLGLCDPSWPITYSLNTSDHTGDPDLECKIFSAVTGIQVENLSMFGERIANLQRTILLREGRKVPESDYPPGYNFSEPLGSVFGTKMYVPGPGDTAVDTSGYVLDMNKYAGILKEYYSLRGWDEKGIPLSRTLADQGLADLQPAIKPHTSRN